ncbi:MAG: hypothetical protein V7603_3996 [Micromonosporaceae bacterium]
MTPVLPRGTIGEILGRHVAEHPERPAVIFVQDPSGDADEIMTYGELGRRAGARSRWLRDRLSPGSRVVLALPTGPWFVEAYVGCLMAGMVAVPTPVPDSSTFAGRRTASVVRDCGAALILTLERDLPAVAACVGPAAPGPAGSATDAPILVAADAGTADVGGTTATITTAGSVGSDTTADLVGLDDLVLLQYTSGSTGDPKGVMVGHANLLANVAACARRLEASESTRFGGWIPLHHDMGLIVVLTTPLLLGGSCVLMRATAFLRRPVDWLRLIDRYDVAVSAAPNFAFDLCRRMVTDEQLAGVDLARWQVVVNGSEPIHAPTMTAFIERFAAAGFRAETMSPGYGMAEATVYITIKERARRPLVRRIDAARADAGEIVPGVGREIVSCGAPDAFDVCIVDPGTRAVLAENTVGEVWLRGPSIARGYWGRPEATAETFNAETADGDAGWLRTGDLGALVAGEVYVTGRRREMMIVHGRNLYPQDLEQEARAAHPALTGHFGAAFGVAAPDERVVIVQEIGPRVDPDELPRIVWAIARQVSRSFAIGAGNVLLVRRGGVRRTTSGKIERTAMRRLFLAGELHPVHAIVEPAVARLMQVRASAARDAPGGGPGHAPPRGAVDEFEAALETIAGLSPARCAELDRSEEFPAAICAELDLLGLSGYYVPAEHGGRLASYPEALRLWRAVARRDVTVAVAHVKTFLGAVCVWLAGDEAQARDLANRIMGGARVSWALSEPAHGADLLAGDVVAVREGDGYRLHGRKWLINNATLGSHLCVLARTDTRPGPRSFSLFLVDKDELAAAGYHLAPKVRTLGVRGADISGITFHGAGVRRSALVGVPGSGLETVLCGLQLTRILCTALSLGAGEHAVRVATRFAVERIIQERPLIDRPNVRAILARCGAALLAVEAVATVAARAIHSLTGELSVLSSVVKALAPTLVDRAIGELGELLGSRSFLDHQYADGAFQKLARDHRVVAIFDGSTVVNRHALINQFPRLVRGYREGVCDDEGLAEAVTMSTGQRPFDPAGLRPATSIGCSIIQGLPSVLERVVSAVRQGHAPAELADATRALCEVTASVHARMATTRPARHPGAAAFDLAAEYELCVAAAACLHLWAANASPRMEDELWTGALWPRIVLRELLACLGHRDVVATDIDAALTDRFVGWLVGAVSADTVSLFAGSNRPGSTTEGQVR